MTKFEEKMINKLDGAKCGTHICNNFSQICEICTTHPACMTHPCNRCVIMHTAINRLLLYRVYEQKSIDYYIGYLEGLGMSETDDIILILQKIMKGGK